MKKNKKDNNKKFVESYYCSYCKKTTQWTSQSNHGWRCVKCGTYRGVSSIGDQCKETFDKLLQYISKELKEWE